MKPRTDANAKAEREFSPAVKERDGYVCRFERWKGERWVEHGIKGSGQNPIFACHIYRRPHLSPSTIRDIRIALAGCDTCHRQYDTSSKLVRVPPEREAVAYQVAKDGCKSPPVRRIPTETPY
jgi:hypothetical protein